MMATIAQIEDLQLNALSVIRDAATAFYDSSVGVQQKTTDLQSRIDAHLSSPIVIDTADKRETASFFLREQASLMKEAEALGDMVKKPSYDLWRSFCILEKDMTDRLKALREAVEPVAMAFDKAERVRKAEEAAAIAAEDRKRQEDAMLAQAEQLEAQGHKELAALILEEPIREVSVVTMPEPKREGESRQTKWKHDRETIDIMALARAVVEGLVPPRAIEPNHKYLAAKAASDRQFARVPGVRFFEEEKLAIRA